MGYVLSATEKEYEVTGLAEYAQSYDDLTSEFIDKPKNEAEDTIYAYAANSYNSKIGLAELSYAGYIFNMAKADGEDFYEDYNELYLIYSGKVSHSEQYFTSARVYFPVKFSDIVIDKSEISYSNTPSIIGSSEFDRGWYYTKGYTNPLIAYKELVEANRDNYVSEVGDGFEGFAETKTISKLSDISQAFKNELVGEAKDIIESYVASYYSSKSQLGTLSLNGEYLLVAKNQGMDYLKNNKYILVFSATVSHVDGRFDPTLIFFPVEFDGIVALPDDDFMVTAIEGIIGNSRIGDSSYYTDGYVDGTEMYNKIVTANRDLYTYEVSEGLKEFGE